MHDADIVAQNKGGAEGAVEVAQLLLSKGADPRARTRDGMSPSAVVALDTERSGKRISNQDDDVRELLEVAEEEADS